MGVFDFLIYLLYPFFLLRYYIQGAIRNIRKSPGFLRSLTVGTFAVFSTLSIGTTRRLLNTHGYFRSLILFLFLRPAYDQLDRMEDHVVWASEDVIERCRRTYMRECNMSAIAGTIIAQVALTSLVLPNLSQAHWIARSAFLLSLVSGCLAVYYASLLQRNLGNFRTPEQVREWWRCSRAAEREEEEEVPRAHRPPSRMYGVKAEFESNVWKLCQGSGKKGPKLQASVAAAILMSSPSVMINFALGAFLTGIGVYLGFVWRDDLDTIAGRSESRNVFVCFLISLGFCYSFYVFPSLSKLVEDYKKFIGFDHNFESFFKRLDSTMKRLWALEKRERRGPEKLLGEKELLELNPLVVKFAGGARVTDFRDDRSINELLNVIENINRLLDEWHVDQADVLESKVIIREGGEIEGEQGSNGSKASDKVGNSGKGDLESGTSKGIQV